MGTGTSEESEVRKGVLLTLNFWLEAAAAVISLGSIIVTVWFSLPTSAGLVLVSTVAYMPPATSTDAVAAANAAPSANVAAQHTFGFLLKNVSDHDFNQTLELYCDTCKSLVARPIDGRPVEVVPKDKTWVVRDFDISRQSARLLTLDATTVGFPSIDIVEPDVHQGSGQKWVNWSIIIVLSLFLIFDVPLTYNAYWRLGKYHTEHSEVSVHVGSIEEQLASFKKDSEKIDFLQGELKKLSKRVDNLKKGVAEQVDSLKKDVTDTSSALDVIRNKTQGKEVARSDIYSKKIKTIFADSGHFSQILNEKPD